MTEHDLNSSPSSQPPSTSAVKREENIDCTLTLGRVWQ